MQTSNNIIKFEIGQLIFFFGSSIRYRNPTPERTPEVPVKWKPVRTSKLEYLHIGNSKNLRMDDELFTDRVNFWSSIPHRGKVELKGHAHHTRDEL